MDWVLRDRDTAPGTGGRLAGGQSLAEAWTPPEGRGYKRSHGARVARAAYELHNAHPERSVDDLPAVPAMVGTAASPAGVIVCSWGQLRQLGDILNASPHLKPTREALQIIVVPDGTGNDGSSQSRVDVGAALDLARLDGRNIEHAVSDCPRESLYEPAKLADGELELDLRSCMATRRGRPIGLKRTEFRILYALMRCRGAVLSRSQLMAMVWSRPSVEMRTIDVHIRRLRQALNGPGERDLIRTVRGLGYALA